MGYITKTMEPVRLVIEEYPAHLPYRALFESENVRALAFLPLVHQEKTGRRAHAADLEGP